MAELFKKLKLIQVLLHVTCPSPLVRPARPWGCLHVWALGLILHIWILALGLCQKTNKLLL